MISRILPILPLFALFFPALGAAAESREEQWKEVAEAVEKGRPKTAVEILEPIIESARAEGAYAEAIKALAKKIAYEGQIEGGKAEENIQRLEEEIPQWPEASHPILETVLAHWYWNFFQQNRWRFLQRTQTSEAPGDDILTWALPRILAEIDSHFTKALSAPEALQAIPISEYSDLLNPGTAPKSFRPTLYDFIAHEALRFYTAGEQAGSAGRDDFQFTARGPALGSVDDFLAWEVKTTDTDAPEFKAIQLFQSLLSFHQADENRDAFIDADLARIVFAYNKAYGEDKKDRYEAALESFIENWSDHRISARARAHLATLVKEAGDLVRARKIAAQGFELFPDTPGGKLCGNIVEEIELEHVQVQVERVWNDPWPEIKLHYRNIDHVYFRMVRYDWEEFIKGNRRWGFENLETKQVVALMKKKPAAEWDSGLPATADFQIRTEKIPVPQDLKPGFYLVFASHDKNFSKPVDNVTSYARCWVSNLSLVTRVSSGDGKVGGFVLDAQSGEPIEGAQVRSWRLDREGKFSKVKPVKTNADGLFSIATDNQHNRGLALLAEHEGQRVSSVHNVANYLDKGKVDPFQRTFFFTDRALYRPGQTISYKGITVRVDQKNDDYSVQPQKNVVIVFRDPNGKEIARQTHQSNDYGSFHGSFTAPRDRVMGRMQIYSEGDSSGSTNFNVEEYKRPKFKVTLEAPEEAAQLDGEVELTGKATSYTGAAIDGASVTYRVVREVRYPVWWRWCYWWLPPNPGGSQEIASGKVETAVDGSFPITFTATPDRSVLKEDEPTFRYTIYADVTDTTGETRSDQKVINIGYTALKAALSASDWQEKGTPVEVSVSTTTLDGEAQAAEGTVKVYRLKEPEEVQRAALGGGHHPQPRFAFVNGQRQTIEPEPDLSNPDSWELGELASEKKFDTDATGSTQLKFDLDSGLYRAMLTTRDKFGNEVTARLPLQVLNPKGKNFRIKLPNVVAAPKWMMEPGETFQALWGTGYDSGRAYIEIEHRKKLLGAQWTDPDRTQSLLKQTVDEGMRGGFTLRVTQVKENRAYFTQRKVNVPWTNKELEVKWSHHTSKLEPGQKEIWTATVSGPDAKNAVAEVAAALYDESLDAYLPHRWMSAFSVFRQDSSRLNSNFQNQVTGFQRFLGNWPRNYYATGVEYPSFPQDILAIHSHLARPGMLSMRSMRREGGVAMDALDSSAPMAATAAFADPIMPEGAAKAAANGDKAGAGGAPTAPKPDLDQVSARTNLQETAFFFPTLVSNKDGSVDLEFTMPEALTTWKFFAFAHDKDLRSGFLTDSVLTQKDIMVQPNPPRFLREGDELEFSVKVTNLSPTRQEGTVRLTLSDARTTDNVDAALGNVETDLNFEIPPKESRSYSWKLKVPDGQGFLIYKAVASTGKLSDGEEGYLPVLPRRIHVTESMPLPIRGAGEKQFDFTKLIQSAKSDSLDHESVTVQMVSNPSWYAVMALPYLMEYPHQCSEQIFNRLYANALARHIAESDPKIRRVFDQWRGTDALDSPLEKNEDLKAVALEETPWLRQGEKESQARKNVGILFEQNRINSELAKAAQQLAQQQLGDGAWPWFPGGRGNDYITLYITTGYGRLRHLGVDEVDVAPAVKSLTRLDGWIHKIYREIVKHGHKDKNNLSPTIALYLYGRSFFLEDRAIDKKHREAVDYFLAQAAEHWLSLGARQSQAHLAIALQRFGVHPEAPKDILISLEERSVSNEEMGKFWRDTELSYWWYRAPIETQAMMIEAFDEVAKDAEAVEDLKVWLLKQKQTRDWKTTKATADAVYALLLRGSDLLASDALVEVSLAGQVIEPKNVEAGTGFYEQKFFRGEVTPEMGKVSVTKTDEGVSWGSVHWQYFESMEKITPHEGTPLKLEKTLYTKVNSNDGPVLEPVKEGDKIEVGDELVVRLVLRTDRDMEYLHLKDQRGSGTEPVNVLSRYRYQDGLGYYESTRDTASHFFIDYLPKGTYVFEYSVRVQHRGEYQSGLATIQCLYAPEFNSHSQSFILKAE